MSVPDTHLLQVVPSHCVAFDMICLDFLVNCSPTRKLESTVLLASWLRKPTTSWLSSRLFTGCPLCVGICTSTCTMGYEVPKSALYTSLHTTILALPFSSLGTYVCTKSLRINFFSSAQYIHIKKTPIEPCLLQSLLLF